MTTQENGRTKCPHGKIYLCVVCEVEKELNVYLRRHGFLEDPKEATNQEYIVLDKNNNELGIINPTNTTKDEFIEKVKELKEGKNVP